MSTPLPSGRWRRLAPVVLLIALLATYANSLSGAFVFDDVFLEDTLSGPDLWSVRRWLATPRPAVEASFALSHALGGGHVAAYHLGNMLIHLIAALALFGIVRRTLEGPALQGRFGRQALPLALVIALLWLVHPLQTQAVTYLIQRGESLMGMCYLLTLYAALRSFASERRPPVRWWVLAAVLCALGMASKPVMVSAPLAVLLYDRLFCSESLRAAWRRSWGLYLGLGFASAILVAIQATQPAHPSAGFGMTALTPWEYARSQPGVILHYLRLSFWPHPLCLDYLWPVARDVWRILPPMAVVGALFLVTLWGIRKRSPWSFPAMGFFLILAPTSSVMPIMDLCFEHRMYLSLASVVALTVLGFYALGQAVARARPAWARPLATAGIGLALAATLALGARTIVRNGDYRTAESIWTDVLRQRPNNPRAHVNLGKILRSRGQLPEALAHYLRALELHPPSSDLGDVYYNVGNARLDLGQLPEAEAAFRQALQCNPDYYRAHNNLGIALARQNRPVEAAREFEAALRLNLHYAMAHENLGLWLLRQGRLPEAEEHLLAALRTEPRSAKSRNGLAVIRLRQGNPAQAAEQFEAALRARPDWPEPLFRLAWIRATSSDPRLRDGAEAVRLAERGVQLPGGAEPEFLDGLAAAYAEAGRFDEAVATARKALDLARQAGKPALADTIVRRLTLYENRQAYHTERAP